MLLIFSLCPKITIFALHMSLSNLGSEFFALYTSLFSLLSIGYCLYLLFLCHFLLVLFHFLRSFLCHLLVPILWSPFCGTFICSSFLGVFVSPFFAFSFFTLPSPSFLSHFLLLIFFPEFSSLQRVALFTCLAGFVIISLPFSNLHFKTLLLT